MHFRSFGRHNDSDTVCLASAGFMTGAVMSLLLLVIFPVPEALRSTDFWFAFWAAPSRPQALLLWLPCLGLALWQQARPMRRRWLVGLVFALQGAALAFSCFALCQASDTGVYLALFSAVLPAFFLLLSQLLVLASRYRCRRQVALCGLCFGIAALARLWGAAQAAQIYFGSIV